MMTSPYLELPLRTIEQAKTDIAANAPQRARIARLQDRKQNGRD